MFEILRQLNQTVNFLFAMNFYRIDEVSFEYLLLIETRGLA